MFVQSESADVRSYICKDFTYLNEPITGVYLFINELTQIYGSEGAILIYGKPVD